MARPLQLSLNELDTALTVRVLTRIRQHPIENKIKSKVLEAEFLISNVKMCQIARFLRRQGEPIGSTGEGYYYGRNETELEPTFTYLESRAKDVLETVALMKRRFSSNPVPTLESQVA